MTAATPDEDKTISITEDLSASEAAELLSRLDEGARAAWQSTHEVPWLSPDYEARFQAANEVDSVFHHMLRETLESGMRRPGETVQGFARRAGSEAKLADARQAGAGAAAQLITRQADAAMDAAATGRTQGDSATGLLADADTEEGQAFAREFDDTTGVLGGDLRDLERERDHDRGMVPASGTPHPDPFLAERGWHVCSHGLYTRRTGPQPQAPPEPELEAG